MILGLLRVKGHNQRPSLSGIAAVLGMSQQGQREVQDFCVERGILIQAWSPIGGITFYRDGSQGSTLEDPVIVAIAERHRKSPAQVMLRWH